MKNKIVGLFAFSIFALVFLMSAVSAALSFVPSTIDQTIFHGQTSTTINFQVNNTGASPVLVTFSETLNPVGVSWALPSPITITNDSSASFSAILSGISSDFIGPIISNIKVENTTTLLDNLLVTINVTAPQEVLDCSENPADLEVKNIDFNNNGFSGREFGSDDEWFFLDEIEVEIEVENDGNWDVDDISLEWGIYDIGKQDWVIDLDEEDEFNLKHGDEETLVINFKLDDDLDLDFDEIEGYYRFYVIATGTIDDSDAGTFDDEDTCAFDFEDAEAIIESDFVVLDNIEFPESARCGETIEVTADIWNTGNRDQEDVSVFITNKELGLREDILVGDIDEFDNQHLSFTFTIPEDAEEKRHLIKLTVYDEDNDIYENDYDDDQSVFSVFLKVEGNCKVAEEITISASLESEAKAGKEMVVGVLLTNTADVTRSFTLEASGYEMWAELSELPGLLTLNADSAGEVLLKLDIKKGISGEQTFLILVYSDNKLITTQPVSVNVESAKPFLGITGLVTTDNAYLWGIGLLNIILIIIIILVAVRIARRK